MSAELAANIKVLKGVGGAVYTEDVLEQPSNSINLRKFYGIPEQDDVWVVTDTGHFAGQEGWRAFNHSSENPRFLSNVARPKLTIQLPSVETVLSYGLLSKTGGDTIWRPHDWNIEGSNNGIDWDILHQVSDFESPPSNALSFQYWDLTTTGSYLYYRINVTVDDGYSGIVELKFYNSLTKIDENIITPPITSYEKIISPKANIPIKG